MAALHWGKVGIGVGCRTRLDHDRSVVHIFPFLLEGRSRRRVSSWLTVGVSASKQEHAVARAVGFSVHGWVNETVLADSSATLNDRCNLRLDTARCSLRGGETV